MVGQNILDPDDGDVEAPAQVELDQGLAEVMRRGEPRAGVLGRAPAIRWSKRRLQRLKRLDIRLVRY